MKKVMDVGSVSDAVMAVVLVFKDVLMLIGGYALLEDGWR